MFSVQWAIGMRQAVVEVQYVIQHEFDCPGLTGLRTH